MSVKEGSAEVSVAAPPREVYSSEGAVVAGGRSVPYVAKAAFVPLLEGDTERAEVFFTYYAARAEGASRRPLTFVLNGGPGASSAYLHVGALGPRRLAMNDDGSLPSSPARLVDNAESWLAFTDLCFIDPVGCGLSRLKKPYTAPGTPEKPEEDRSYWTVEKDLSSLCAFVDAFLSREKRWSSPICLAGESYGGYRVARLTRMLQEKAGVGLCAAYLISPVLEWDTLFATRFVAQRFMALFPSLVASAVAHGRSRASLKEAETFAVRELVPAITPRAMDPAAREALYPRIAALSGLKEEVVRRFRGRIDMDRFCRELLRDEGKTLGRYDAYVTTADPFPDQDGLRAVDPTLGGVTRLFNVAINAHLREGLGVDQARRYELLNFEVNEKWCWRDTVKNEPLPPGAAEDLLLGLGMDSRLRVVISHGHFDLVTPYFDSDLLVDRLEEESPLAARIGLRHYPGGHMFYSRRDAREAWFNDVREDFAGLGLNPA
jgi:carboxypeptidase C (cathepsin A)